MTLWGKTIRNGLTLYAVVFTLILVYFFPLMSGFCSWSELTLCIQEAIFLMKIKKNPHVQQIEHEHRGYWAAPTGWVSKYALRLDNGLKIFIIGIAKNSVDSDWQVLAVGDSIAYKVTDYHKTRYEFFSRIDGDYFYVSTISISDMHHFLPNISSLSDVINSSEEVYDWIKKLPCETRPSEFFFTRPYMNPHTGETKENFSASILKDMHSDFVYSSNNPAQVRQDIYYKKGIRAWKWQDKYAKAATYSFYRMNLDDHHVPETEDVTAIMQEYYDW